MFGTGGVEDLRCPRSVAIWSNRNLLGGDALASVLDGEGYSVSVVDNSTAEYLGPVDIGVVVLVEPDPRSFDTTAAIESIVRVAPQAGVVLVADDELQSEPPSGGTQATVVSSHCSLTDLEAAMRSAASRRRRPVLSRRYVRDTRMATDSDLTSREIDVLRLVAKGHRNQDVAEILGISVHTVRTHMQNILSKLEVGTRLAAVMHARGLGLLESKAS